MSLAENGILRFVLILLCSSVPVAFIEYLICKFSRAKVLKYILPLFTFLSGSSFIIYARFVPTEGFLDLAYILLAILSFAASIAACIVLVVYELIKNKHVK